jgi:hypothetical protein
MASPIPEGARKSASDADAERERQWRIRLRIAEILLLNAGCRPGGGDQAGERRGGREGGP